MANSAKASTGIIGNEGGSSLLLGRDIGRVGTLDGQQAGGAGREQLFQSTMSWMCWRCRLWATTFTPCCMYRRSRPRPKRPQSDTGDIQGMKTLDPQSQRCAQLAVKLHDVSAFMQELEQPFTRWFNRTRPVRRRGHLWAERFKNTILENGLAVWDCWPRDAARFAANVASPVCTRTRAHHGAGSTSKGTILNSDRPARALLGGRAGDWVGFVREDHGGTGARRSGCRQAPSRACDPRRAARGQDAGTSALLVQATACPSGVITADADVAGVLPKDIA